MLIGDGKKKLHISTDKLECCENDEVTSRVLWHVPQKVAK